MHRFEYKRAFCGTGMKLALLLGTILAAAQFFEFALPHGTVNMFLKYPDGDWGVPYSFWNNWLGREMFSLSSYCYTLLMPVLAVLPFADSYCTDVNSGYIKQIAVRADKGAYLRAKMGAALCSGGLATIFPFIVNFFLCSAFIPIRGPKILNSNIGSTILFGELYLNTPFLYFACSFLLIFAFCGLMTWIALLASLAIQSRFLVLVSPFAVWLCTDVVTGYFFPLDQPKYSAMHFLQPGRILPCSVTAIFLEFALLLLVGMVFYLVARRRDTF